MSQVPLARLAIWALCIGAVIVIVLILGGSEDAQAKVGVTALLFVLFSLNSLPGFLLIERRPEATPFGALAIGLSVAAYFVLLDSLFSHGLFETGGNSYSIELLVTITLVASQASMLLSFRRDEDSPLVNAVLAGSLVLLASFVVLTILAVADVSIGTKVYASLAVLYLLSALLPPCLRWEETEAT